MYAFYSAAHVPTPLRCQEKIGNGKKKIERGEISVMSSADSPKPRPKNYSRH